MDIVEDGNDGASASAGGGDAHQEELEPTATLPMLQ